MSVKLCLNEDNDATPLLLNFFGSKNFISFLSWQNNSKLLHYNAKFWKENVMLEHYNIKLYITIPLLCHGVQQVVVDR